MKLKFIILSVLAVSAVVSCTKNEAVSTSTKESEIIVQAGVVQTRAGYGSNVLPETFVMDVKQNSVSKYDYESVYMEQSGNNYVPYDPDFKMVWAGTAYSSVEVKAITLPFGMSAIDAENPMDISVSCEQNNGNNLLMSDLLVADSKKGDISVENSNIKINFRHMMSKLDITCKSGTGLDVKINSVLLENVCVKGQYSYADMAIVADNGYDFDNVSMYVDESGQNLVFEAIFFPYKPTENPVLKVNATIGGEQREMTCVVTPNSSGFVSGKRYTMTVAINGTTLTPVSDTFTIETQWGDGNNDADFDLDFGADMEIGDDVFVTE